MHAGITLANIICAFCYFFVAISGYSSYGNTVADDVLASYPRPAQAWVGIANFMVWLHVLASYQVFSHPIFDAVESILAYRFPKVPILVVRLVWRTGYVLWVTVIAASFPFFGEIVGLIGAAGFIPMTFIMPHVLWLAYKKDLGWSRFINYALLGIFSIIAIASLIGSIASIAHKSSEFEYWT
jgi:amino acid permease